MRTNLLSTLRFGALLCLWLNYVPTYSQDEAEEDKDGTEKEKDTRPLKDRIFFGGGLNLQFGTVTNLGIAPMIGYKIDRKNKWSAGLGGNYNYVRTNSQFGPPASFSSMGYRAFTRYRFIPQLYAHAEFSQQSVFRNNSSDQNAPRVWVPYLLVGGGFAQQLAGRTYLTLQVLFDVIQDPRGFGMGRNPYVSGGIVAGF